MFELKDHDGLGRLGVLTVNEKSIKTPNLAVVVNPNELSIHPKELKDYGVNLIITNAYIIKNSKKAGEIEGKGLHDYFSFPGVIYTDSGTYQMYSQGDALITNKETLDYQEKLGSDIHTPLDLFTTPSDNKKTARFKLEKTVERIKEVKSSNYSAPIQGGSYLDLRREACKEVSKLPATIYPIGGIVPYMVNYDFKQLVKIIIECKKHLPLNTPVHAFGAGHPLVFSLLTYAGVDLFDSASYALYARNGKYITETGTKKAESLTSLPCSCPVCTSHKPRELRKFKHLVRHNLHALMRELRVIRQAIQEDKLFELVYSRAMSHPNVYYTLKWLLKNKELLSRHDPVRKRRALFWTGGLSDERPEIYHSMNQVRSLGFRKVPRPLKLVYPFGQSLGWSINYSKKKYNDIGSLRLIADYQFGKGAGKKLIPKSVRIIKTRNQRMHQVYLDDELLFVVRARDGYYSLHSAGAERIKKHLKKVEAPEEFKKFYLKGRDVFAKHVVKCDDDIKPRMDVGVFVNKKLVAVGESLLSSQEMMSFNWGTAVKVREAL